MHQIKIFKGIESETALLEKQVNEWLARENARVISVSGNIAPQSQPVDITGGSIRANPWPPSDVVIIVHYDK